MTREEFYKLTDILNTEVLGNFMHGGEADELIAMFEEAVEHSNILEQEEIVSEELEEEIDNYVKRNGYDGLDSIEEVRYIANHFAKWQKQQDQSTIELAEDHAMLAGMEKMKEQMMKDAIDGKVTDARSYESYKIDEIDITVDYDKDTTPFVVDDMVKLIIIKED